MDEDQIELSALDMRTIMTALYASDDDASAELHDRLATSFARDADMDGGYNTATLTVRAPVP